MNNAQFDNYNNIPKEKFSFAREKDNKHDAKLDTKPIGYLRDAFNRFKKNKASIFAAIVILILVLYAIVGPFFAPATYKDAYGKDNTLLRYKELLPRLKMFDGTGFLDGTKTVEIGQNVLYKYQGMEIETGYNPIEEILGSRITTGADGKQATLYKVRLNTYYGNSAFMVTLSAEQWQDLQAWQDENQLQVILPWVKTERMEGDAFNVPLCTIGATQKDYWYICDSKGTPKLDDDGNFQPCYVTGWRDDYTSQMRLEGDPGIEDPTSAKRYTYAQRTGKDGNYNYVVRVASYNYFQYKYGFEPAFLFGTDSNGYDIFSRLASGARFSFLLAILVSVVNLTIGAVYGAIEGYFGGIVDMTMERISDVLSGVPFMVVTVLFQLHLSAKVGVIGALIFSFVLTGWIGMASRVRMQFYRFKNQEYVLAARTLGAKDWRIIWKHIFPNTLGTLITGCVLVIPGVIFSETSLSYLGVINLDSPELSSVGSMLSAGQSVMTSAPHVVFFPALFIALLEICFNLFGNGLRDAFNPSLRGTED